MKRLDGKVVAVTGAASGIGLEMARAFAKQGARLVLADINISGLQTAKTELEASGVTVYAQLVDVTKEGAGRIPLRQRLPRARSRGRAVQQRRRGLGRQVEDFPLDAWEQIVSVNFWSVIYGFYYFYPRMIEQGGGHIVNTASGAGLMLLPSMSAYCSTKFAVQGFSEILRAEAALHNIGVTVVGPGVIRTNIMSVGRFFSSTQNTSPQDFLKKVDGWYGKRNYTPDRVAAKIVKAVRMQPGCRPRSP